MTLTGEAELRLRAADVFWGWVAQESTGGWQQLAGGRPQLGKGKPLGEWRVQAVEEGGWGGVPSKAWFATFRLRIR